MRLGILMDPLSALTPHKDSTVAMIQAAIKLGWECYYFTQNSLVCREGRPYARMSQIIEIKTEVPHEAKTYDMVERPLSNLDIILMRKDPPFDIEYIYSTYVLDLAVKEGVLVSNCPQSLRDANEKFFTLQFPQCCPTTIVSRNINILREFWTENEEVIFKPLAGMGGSSVFHVGKNGVNLSVILEMLTQNQNVTVMAQKYIPAISKTGDKRILLINGDPVPHALARIPAKGELRGNLAAGATGVVVELTERDRWICNEIAPLLRQKGLYFVGIDVIGDYLTEINVTSPTCIREIERETSLDIAVDYLNFLESLI